jgi:translation elongation factor IF5A
MSSDEETFDTVDAGASNCIPIEAGSVRKGGFLVIKGRPTKIVDVSKAKVGKHGAAKCHFVGIDIFNQKKYEQICPASAQLAEPIVTRTEYTLVDISDDGYLSLMASDNTMRDDLKVPDDTVLAKRLKDRLDEGKDTLVTILGAMGDEQCMDLKEAAGGN